MQIANRPIRRKVVEMEILSQTWRYGFKLECGHWQDKTIYSVRFKHPKTMRCYECEKLRAIQELADSKLDPNQQS